MFVVLVNHLVATLRGGMNARGKGLVTDELVDMVCEQVDVWNYFMNKGAGARRDLVCCKSKQLWGPARRC